MADLHNPYMLTIANPARKKRRIKSSVKRHAGKKKKKNTTTTTESNMKKITKHNPTRRRKNKGGGMKKFAGVAKSTIKDIAMPVAGFYAVNIIGNFIKDKLSGVIAPAAPAPTQGISNILTMQELGSKAAALFAVFLLEKHVTKTHGLFEGAAIGTAVNLISKSTEGGTLAKYTRISAESDPMLEDEEVISGAEEIIGEVIGEDFAPMGEVIGEDDEDGEIGATFSPVGG